MPFDIDALLSLAECVKPRKPKELREWVLAKCNTFAQIPELREPVLLHEGFFKWFMRKSIRSVCSRFVDTETARTFF